MKVIPSFALLGLFIAGCLPALHAATTPPARINHSRLLENIRVLASDEFEGRGPGSPGEDRTVEFLSREFSRAGLKPGMPDGSWTQDVPIVGIRSSVTAAWTSDGRRRELVFPQDFVTWSPKTNELVSIPETEMVFVGYGVTAPEYRWDDYKGFDVRGKTVVILVNDPPVPDATRPGELDPKWFQGRAMTYYGRWTYKYEEAARRGAAAALLIHETKAAAYPWFVVINSWGKERFELAADTDPKVALAGWLSLDAARELLTRNGLSYEDALALAVRPDFKPRTLGQRFAASASQQVRRVRSRNVVARLDGSDQRHRSNAVVYTAHWDHLGRDPKGGTDAIYNGAADNAVGVAGLLELARAFAADPRRTRRTVLFMAPTAEEQGLLGARHFALESPVPAERMVANINMDGLNTWGRTRDLKQIGLGHSSLDDVLRKIADSHRRRVLPDPNPERGMFYRSDHFEFMKRGVPALYVKSGDDYLDHPAGYGQQRVNEYIDRDYHKVSDEVKPDWDLRGAAEDLEILFEVGRRLAESRDWPQWRKGSEFRTPRPRGAGLR